MKIITDQFAPLMKHFHIFFWEEIKTNIGNWSGFIVEEASAAPILDNTERRGVDATHSGMIKFSDRSSSGYRTAIAALTRYYREAPKIIRNRWKVAREALGRARCNEAFELMGMTFDTYSGHNSADENEMMGRLGRAINTFFRLRKPLQISWEDISGILKTALFLAVPGSSLNQRRKFVVHGMGGSGKTQICSKSARDNRERYLNDSSSVCCKY